MTCLPQQVPCILERNNQKQALNMALSSNIILATTMLLYPKPIFAPPEVQI